MIIDARHKFIAHSDSDIREVTIFPPGTSIHKDIYPGDIGISVQSIYLELNKFTDIHETCHCLGTRSNEAIDQLMADLYDGLQLPNAPCNMRIDEGL